MLPVPPRLKFHGNTHAAKQFKRFALSQLEILKKQMSFQGLKQGVRRVSPFEGVLIECVSKFGLHVVNVFIAPVHGKVSLGGQEICTIPITHKEDLKRVYALIHCVWRRWDPVEAKYKPSCLDMTAEDEEYTKFIFTPGYALASPHVVGDFSQVRYTQMSGDTLIVASALHYIESTGEEANLVIQIIGETGCPNFIERYSVRDHAKPYIVLSLTLDAIYTTVVRSTDSTSFGYRKFNNTDDQFVIQVDEWIETPTGYSCISGTPHRDGTAGSFAKETHHFTDESTDEWGGGSPVDARHRETTDIYNDYYSLEPYTVQISSKSLVACNDLFIGLVVMVDESGDWDYRSYKSSDTLVTGYWAESYCSASWTWTTAMDDYSGGGNTLIDRGDRYIWELCALSEERGHLGVHYLLIVESSIDNSYDPVIGWTHTYSWSKVYEDHILIQGFQTNTMNFVASIKDGVEYTINPSSGSGSGTGNMVPTTGPFNNPCGSAPSSSTIPEYFDKLTTLYHPCKEPIVDIFSPGAITCAYDQELRLSFYEYRYKPSAALGVSYQSYICVRNKSNTETNITDQVYAAMIVEIDKDIDAGIIANMTHEEKITHCMETFMYIYFEEVSNTVYDV
jgi:hypothetical protein